MTLLFPYALLCVQMILNDEDYFVGVICNPRTRFAYPKINSRCGYRYRARNAGKRREIWCRTR